MDSTVQLSFIILVWNSERYLNGCFDSILHKCNTANISFEILLINNGSHDDSLGLIKQYQKKYPNIFHLIPLACNCGTTYSRNLGLKQARGKSLCILDSDTELADGNLANLLNRLHIQSDIGIIAPRLLLPNGSIQNSVKRFPTMVDKLLKIARILLGLKTKNADFYENFPFTVETDVDSAISACWFFRKSLLDQVGYLDENIFYSPEDLDYSMRVKQTGLKILYYPSVSVLHHTQQISHQKPFSKTSISHFMGLIYYYRKHGGWIIRPRYGSMGRHVG